MAEVNVSTWDEIVAVLTTGTEDTTINLTKDIDLHDVKIAKFNYAEYDDHIFSGLLEKQ